MIRCIWRSLIVVALVSAMAGNLPAAASRAREDAAWRAEYYSNAELIGEAAAVREDAQINFQWKLGSPDWRVPADGFSARWTRTVKLEWSGNYRFYINSDDGMRVWVDDILLINQWFDWQEAWTTADIYLAEGQHKFKVEYFENVGSATAQVVFQPEGDGTGGTWKSEYFVNPDLDGEPGFVSSDAHIDFNWGGGSPAEWIPADWFSARYTRDVIFAAGAYQFNVTLEGGARLYVDEALILDHWDQVGKTTLTANAALTSAVHRVRLEYTHTWRNASLYLSWQPAPTISGWKAEYFDGETPNTTPTIVRDEPKIDFDWGDNPPFTGMPREHWSARWTRTMNLDAGYYRFTTTTDDGVRLWVDDNLIVDQLAPNDSRSFLGDATLAAGPHTIKIEFYNLTGKAVARLVWQKMNTTDLFAILDDGDPGWTRGGMDSGWNLLTYGNSGRSHWTLNQAGYWARWTPALPRNGRYEVFVYIPWVYNLTSTAHYYLKHEGDIAELAVNQAARAGQWVSLGTYAFNADNSEFVHLDGVTGEATGTRTLGYDAVKFVYQGP